MTDRYSPTLADFEFSEEEQATILAAMSTDKPWDSAGNEPLKAVKNRIRAYHLDRHNHTCCYCRVGLRGRGHFTVDREHILPKSRFNTFVFTMSNLSVACKRCNMEYKRDGIDFVVDPGTIINDHENSDRYLFIHPNFDRWEEHLTRVAVQYNSVEMVHFSVQNGSPKGAYTHEFFNLDAFTVENLDAAQGSEQLDPDGREAMLEFGAKLGVVFGDLP